MSLKTNPYNAPAIILEDGSEYRVDAEFLQELEQNYFGVAEELRAMRMWSLANPPKRKTRRGIKRFIVGWLEGWGGRFPSHRRPQCAPPLAVRWKPRPITEQQRARNRTGIEQLKAIVTKPR
jgi:hypothetical protein